ncbi:MAG TPA: sugar ABC transporter substrate-binding protein [Bacilli bacterium]
MVKRLIFGIRIQRLLLTCLIMAFVLSGCSGGTNEAGNDDKEIKKETAAPTPKPTPEVQKPQEPVKLVVWIWESAKKVIDLNMEAFKAEYPHIDVEFQIMGAGDVYSKFLIASNTADKVPDIVTLETSNLAQMVAIDGLLDLTGQVSPYKDKMNQYKWADATLDGKLYAMPWDSGPVVMFYRKDLFEKSGFSSDPTEVANSLKTWENYYQYAKTIKEKTGAFMLSDSKTSTNARNFETMMWQRGLWYYGDDGKVTLDSPGVIELGNYVVKMTNEGYVYDAEPWSESWLNGIKNGKVATIVGASWFDGLLSSWIDTEGIGKWAVAPMPKWSESDKFGSANDGGSNFTINKNSGHPKEAWQFIEFMLGKETSQTKMLKEGGFFPSLESTYSDPAYNDPVAYFGGQQVRSIFVEAVKQIRPQAYTKDFPVANQMMKDTFAEIFLNKKTADEMFKKAADELRKKTKRE